MAQNTNIVVIVGNLTRDPELRHTPSGTPVLVMGVAVNDRVKKGDEWTDAAYFFDVTVWGKRAETCAQYLAKGRKVGVTGRLIQQRWEKDGQKRSKVEIVATSVEFLTPKGEGNGSTYYGGDADYSGAGGGDPGQQADGQGGESFVPAGVDDDIPFAFLDSYGIEPVVSVRHGCSTRTTGNLRLW